MRRILTSLPYDQRIGLQGATNGLLIGDSIRRTLLLSVADTHQADAVESASGQLVRCDDVGSLLAERSRGGYSEVTTDLHDISTDAGATRVDMVAGYTALYFRRGMHGVISNVYICDAAEVLVDVLRMNILTLAKGVRDHCYLIAFGQPGANIQITAYHFK